MLRQSIIADPRWNGGNYEAAQPPEQGMRLWAGWLSGVIVRTPGYQEAQLCLLKSRSERWHLWK